jgi:hypothetical protein
MPNIQPIFSRVADIQGGVLLIGAAADNTGQNANNQIIATSDATNGGYFQRLRLKATGTVVATVLRIYLNNGNGTDVPVSNVPQTLTGTPSGSGGTLLTMNVCAKVAAVDPWGAATAFSAEAANVAVTGPTGSIVWNWNASSNSNTYLLLVGPTPTSEERLVVVTGANTYTMTSLPTIKISSLYACNGTTQPYNNYFYGEISLPAITGSLTTGSPDIDYPLNFAIPPGWRILCGLGTTTNASNGWVVTAIGGKY